MVKHPRGQILFIGTIPPERKKKIESFWKRFKCQRNTNLTPDPSQVFRYFWRITPKNCGFSFNCIQLYPDEHISLQRPSSTCVRVLVFNCPWLLAQSADYKKTSVITVTALIRRQLTHRLLQVCWAVTPTGERTVTGNAFLAFVSHSEAAKTPENNFTTISSYILDSSESTFCLEYKDYFSQIPPCFLSESPIFCWKWCVIFAGQWLEWSFFNITVTPAWPSGMFQHLYWWISSCFQLIYFTNNNYRADS